MKRKELFVSVALGSYQEKLQMEAINLAMVVIFVHYAMYRLLKVKKNLMSHLKMLDSHLNEWDLI